jgi:SAM-dependent methyltransferase
VDFSSSLRQLIPERFQPAAKAVYYRLFRLHLRLRFAWSNRFARSTQGIPVPPALLRYRVSELISVKAFLLSGEGCAGLIQRSANEIGVEFHSTKRVLDFGCGCGRTIAWLLRDYEAEFHGVDVDADAVAWCQQHLARGHFIANPPVPPLPYPDEYFDLVYCLSVFTHLDQPMQDAWLSELSRILKPGGALLFTVFGLAARERLDPEELRQLQIHGLVHKRSQKLRGLVPDWYHTTFHSREYIVQRLSRWFDDIVYTVVPDGMQDVVAAAKPEQSVLPSARRSSTTVHPDEGWPTGAMGRGPPAEGHN